MSRHVTRFGALVLASAATAVLSNIAAAQTITTLVKDGDVISGIGAVTLINNLAVNNAGTWMVEVDTDNPTTTQDAALLRNGSVFLREDQAITGLATGTLSSFDAFNLNNNNVYSGNVFFRNTGATNNDSGVLLESGLVMQEGTISTAPQFSANTPYVGWLETKINDSGQMLVMASMDDPVITSTIDRAIVLWDVNSSGQLQSETVIAKEGDILPGHDQAVGDFGTGPHDFAFNDGGTAMFIVDGAGDTASDGAIYVGNTLVAREGSASGIGGRNWLTLTTARVHLNKNGDYVHTGVLAGDTTTDNVIVKNGAKIIQEGDTLPAIGGTFTFTSFGTGPVQIDDQGNVVWFGDWNDADTTRDTGIFINDTLLVQEGVTTIDGMLLTSISSGQDAFRLSDNGAYLIFEGQLAGGIDGAFLVAIPEPASMGLAAVGTLGLLARRRRAVA